ncbi:MAG: hypothetical protein IK137_03125 [Bacilli bacterium]|nr:hypothetical protein [Bacilli bacterium]
MDEMEGLIRQLEELKALRDRLQSVADAKELGPKSADIRVYLKDELDIISKDLKDIKEKSKVSAQAYEKYSKKLLEEIDEEQRLAEQTGLLSEERIYEEREKNELKKLEINEKSIEIKKNYDAQIKFIKSLEKKKTEIENRIKESEALGLTYNEYKEIYATLKSRKIMHSVLEKKGLSEIIEKKASERTKEEEKILKETKKEILKEISDFRIEHRGEYDDHSVLDIICAIYSLESINQRYVKVGEPKEVKITEQEKQTIEEKEKEILPYRILNVNEKTVNNTKEEPKEEAPKDMENAMSNEKVDINELGPAEEKVTIFKDNETNDYYVRKYTVDRFKLKSADLGNEIRINGSLCYKISENDVNRIKERANNSFSPYIADVKEVTIEKEEEIKPEDTKDELIPGTIIKRPRDRKPDETDEQYQEFLGKYYSKVFPIEEKEDTKDELISGTTIKKPRDRKPDETDEQYQEFLREYYSKVFPPEEKENTKEETTEPEKETEPEKITEPEKVTEPEKETEPEKITEPEKVTEPKSNDNTTSDDNKKYKPTNIKASKKFKLELREGSILYNIVHIASKIFKGIKRGIRKIVNELEDMLTPPIVVVPKNPYELDEWKKSR